MDMTIEMSADPVNMGILKSYVQYLCNIS